MPAHVDVMEAFEMVGSNATIVEEMKMWLLKQKQTPIASYKISDSLDIYPEM